MDWRDYWTPEKLAARDREIIEATQDKIGWHDAYTEVFSEDIPKPTRRRRSPRPLS